MEESRAPATEMEADISAYNKIFYPLEYDARELSRKEAVEFIDLCKKSISDALRRYEYVRAISDQDKKHLSYCLGNIEVLQLELIFGDKITAVMSADSAKIRMDHIYMQTAKAQLAKHRESLTVGNSSPLEDYGDRFQEYVNQFPFKLKGDQSKVDLEVTEGLASALGMSARGISIRQDLFVSRREAVTHLLSRFLQRERINIGSEGRVTFESSSAAASDALPHGSAAAASGSTLRSSVLSK